jgi:predicted O-methyltransferase YrrM
VSHDDAARVPACPLGATATPAQAARFEAAWAVADTVPGWLTRDQARVLWSAATRLAPGSRIVEIGSHRGRSTVVLALAARASGSTVTAVDPFVDGRLFGGAATRVEFTRNLARAGVADTVELAADYSGRLRPEWRRPVDLLYVDGKHDYWTCRDDLRWRRFLPSDGEVLVHDAFSSVGVTLALVVDCLAGGRLRYLDRVGSLARFDLRPVSAADRRRAAAQLPWFARNVLVKLLLRIRLRPVAALLGHRGPYDPY